MPKLTKNTALAFVNTSTDEVVDILAVGPTDIQTVLSAAQRKAPEYGSDATHVTNTTRKYQCNAALAYEGPIAKLRKANKFATDGAAIRLILEAGLKALGFEDIVEEVEAEKEAQ